MGKFTVGQVVSSAFPFSNLETQKYRPALVVAIVDFDNLILCQITSKIYSSSKPIKLITSSFSRGGLPVDSYIRPDKLFTADETIVSKSYGELKPEILEQVLRNIRNIFTTSK
jgi:mRNA interferase MazF